MDLFRSHSPNDHTISLDRTIYLKIMNLNPLKSINKQINKKISTLTVGAKASIKVQSRI